MKDYSLRERISMGVLLAIVPTILVFALENPKFYLLAIGCFILGCVFPGIATVLVLLVEIFSGESPSSSSSKSSSSGTSDVEIAYIEHEGSTLVIRDAKGHAITRHPMAPGLSLVSHTSKTFTLQSKAGSTYVYDAKGHMISQKLQC